MLSHLVRLPPPPHDVNVAAFLQLVRGRRGHFRLESGHHSELWLDLDPLFAEPRLIAPFVETLSNLIRPYAPTTICGPLLGGAFLAQLVAHALGVAFCFTERVPGGQHGLFQTRYRLPSAIASRMHGQRVAIVDDVMSAGSALRGTYKELQTHGAVPVVAGALLVLGKTGQDFFDTCHLPVCAAARDQYTLWPPADCPLCREGLPVEDVTAPGSD
jgi:orotate phosphoribosyltransferase